MKMLPFAFFNYLDQSIYPSHLCMGHKETQFLTHCFVMAKMETKFG